MTTVEYNDYNDMILEPIRIAMININGTIFNLDNTDININIDEIYKKFVQTEDVIAIKYGEKMKGKIDSIKKSKKRTFYNACQLYITYTNQCNLTKIFKVKITRPGSIHIPGCCFLQDSYDLLEIVYNYLILIEMISPKNTSFYVKTNTKMYTSQLTYNFQYVDLFKFAEIIREEYKVNALYYPSNYYALKVYYVFRLKKNDERNTATIILHKSGKCSINGTNHRWKIREVYEWFNKVIFDNYKRIDAMIT